MKIEDLMVGDWVLTKSSDGEDTHYIKVRDIGEHGINMCGFLEFDEIEPIPLTPEILKRNGFVKSELIFNYDHYIGIDDRVTLHNEHEFMNSNNEWYVHVDSEDYSTIAGCELTYLHELQHLLSLCKINKEFII